MIEREPDELADQTGKIFSQVEEILKIPEGLNFQKILLYLGRNQLYRRKITRVRNPDVLTDRAWKESQVVLTYLIPGYGEGRYSAKIIKDLFFAYRTAFVSNLKDSAKVKIPEIIATWRQERRNILGRIDSEVEFELYDGIAKTVFELGLFRGPKFFRSS